MNAMDADSNNASSVGIGGDHKTNFVKELQNDGLKYTLTSRQR